MDVAGVTARQLLAQLADRFEERQALDIAHRTAHLDQHEINALARIGQDEILDLAGDVRDHLDGGTEVVAPPLLLDDGLVDLAGGHIVGACGIDPGEPLIVTQV